MCMATTPLERLAPTDPTLRQTADHQATVAETATPGEPGVAKSGGARYCFVVASGTALAATALVDAITGSPFS